MNNTFNGWKNYETWNVALYINNDEFQRLVTNMLRDEVYSASQESAES